MMCGAYNVYLQDTLSMRCIRFMRWVVGTAEETKNYERQRHHERHTHTVHILRTVISTRHLANASLEKSTFVWKVSSFPYFMKTLPALLFGKTPRPP